MAYWVCRAKATDAWKAPEMYHLLKEVEQTDLVNYGLIPEFVGRFPVICSLQVSCLSSTGIHATGRHHSPEYWAADAD